MVFVRCYLVIESTFYLRKAVTIAVRYSAVRRQVCTNCKLRQGQLLELSLAKANVKVRCVGNN